MGVDVMRVGPRSAGTLDAIAALDAIHARAARAGAVTPPAGIGRCNGYYYGRSGIELLETAA